MGSCWDTMAKLKVWCGPGRGRRVIRAKPRGRLCHGVGHAHRGSSRGETGFHGGSRQWQAPPRPLARSGVQAEVRLSRTLPAPWYCRPQHPAASFSPRRLSAWRVRALRPRGRGPRSPGQHGPPSAVGPAFGRRPRVAGGGAPEIAPPRQVSAPGRRFAAQASLNGCPATAKAVGGRPPRAVLRHVVLRGVVLHRVVAVRESGAGGPRHRVCVAAAPRRRRGPALTGRPLGVAAAARSGKGGSLALTPAQVEAVWRCGAAGNGAGAAATAGPTSPGDTG